MVDLFSGNRKRSIYIITLALIATIPTYLTQPSNSVLPREGDLTILEKILTLPISFAKVGFIEVAQLVVMDKLLLIVLLVATIAALNSYKTVSSKRFLLILLATWAIGALNGSLGVNFRYQLPVLPFACATLIMNSKVLGDWLLGRVGDVKGKEAKK
jgi:hypothetical protein